MIEAGYIWDPPLSVTCGNDIYFIQSMSFKSCNVKGQPVSVSVYAFRLKLCKCCKCTRKLWPRHITEPRLYPQHYI